MKRWGRAPLTDDPDRFYFTARMELRYKANVPLETDLVVSGRLVKDRGRTVIVEGDITLPDGTLAVEANATMFRVPEEKLTISPEELGWRVYSDDEFEALGDE